MLIAQVTDTHIKPPGELAYGRVDTAACLARCVDHLLALRPAPDVVLMTGDLVDAGAPEEYAHLRRLIAPLAMPVYLIPGNHDDRAALRAAFPDHGYLSSDGRFLQYTIEDAPLRLIGLDTLVPGAVHGELCQARLDWLAARLAEAPDRPTVVFMHHPPFETGIAGMDRYRCRGGEALGALIEQHPQVVRLLCGHVHRAIQLPWHGTLASIAPSPAHAVYLELAGEGPFGWILEPPACQLLAWIEGSGLVGHLSYIGEFDGPYPFGMSETAETA